jgi:hypothetical protein
MARKVKRGPPRAAALRGAGDSLSGVLQKFNRNKYLSNRAEIMARTHKMQRRDA